MKNSTKTLLFFVWTVIVGIFCSIFSLSINVIILQVIILSIIWVIVIITEVVLYSLYCEEKQEERRREIMPATNETLGHHALEIDDRGINIEDRLQEVTSHYTTSDSSGEKRKATYPDIIPERESSILHKIYWMDKHGNGTSVSDIIQKVLFGERVVRKSLEVMISHGLIEKENEMYYLTDRALKVFEG